MRHHLESLDARRYRTVATPVTVIGPSAGNYATVVQPSVQSVTQPATTTNARRDLTVVVALNLPNGAIKFDGLYRSAFRIFEANADGSRASASDGSNIDTGNLGTSGGGDTLSITPNSPLKADQNYRVEINQSYVPGNLKVRDISGSLLQPYTFTFKTGAEIAIADPAINFSQTTATANGEAAPYSAVTTGPDGKLYAATLDGHIYRWTIAPDGSLSARQAINSVLDNNVSSENPDGNRVITGITFDPQATAGSLKLWVSHGQYKFGSTAGPGNGPNFQADNYTGKVSVLSGASLGSYDDVIVGIPRSVKDHMNNQIAFDAGGNNFFFCIPSMSATGRADQTWGYRDENALSAAYVKVNLAKLGTELAATSGPIDLTNAAYDATDPAKALNLWATGVRNAYDMVFHSNGHLYSAVNGSSAGGNTPAGGGAPALTNVPQTEEDVLLDVQSGEYYGHPNPTRGEYVLDGGNPTADVDPYEFAGGSMYPVGTQPDADYALPAYDLGKNVSPDGMIEYTGAAFGGALDGTLLICRYNSGQDILAVKPNADGTVSKANVQARITGLTGLDNPLDIAEDANTGNLYVAQLDEANFSGSIALMKPIAPNPIATPLSQNRVPYRVVAYPSPGSTKGEVQTVRVINNGTTTLEINVAQTKINGKFRKNFVVLNLPADNVRVLPGESFDFRLRSVLARGQTLVNSTNLAFKTNQPGTPYLSFQLRAAYYAPAAATTSLSAGMAGRAGLFSSTPVNRPSSAASDQSDELSLLRDVV